MGVPKRQTHKGADTGGSLRDGGAELSGADQALRGGGRSEARVGYHVTSVGARAAQRSRGRTNEHTLKKRFCVKIKNVLRAVFECSWAFLRFDGVYDS